MRIKYDRWKNWSMMKLKKIVIKITMIKFEGKTN